ncbi:hypothetical protein CJF42_12690 [Pseudoalteromonas sp. NBT06-2]|nr:hypothetical protein CJF42_12690 [Pseudoalteromonas sp. NBT06-2]
MKKLHKYLGFIMIFPFVAWTITGVYFFIKPGYKAAYESLPIKTYPLIEDMQYKGNETWLETRRIRSILGTHLLIKNDKGWQQRDPTTLNVVTAPTKIQIETLLKDAIAHNPLRYGNIISIDGLKIVTDTNIRISLNWSKMSLYQQGKDTDFINRMYKIHYLQWTGIDSIDKVLGIVGLALVLLLAFLGLIMAIGYKKIIG